MVIPEYKVCCPNPLNQLSEEAFSEEEKEEYINSVFVGVTTILSMSNFYHQRISGILNNEVKKVFKDLDLVNEPKRKQIIRKFRQNIYEFSAAKQYQQLRIISKEITTDVVYQDFKKKASEVFDTFNKNYLRTEYDTAINASQSAEAYLDALETKEDFPYVRYVTQNDGKVRPEHRALHNITLPANHNFWTRYWPPNGWNCRCFIVKLENADVTPIKNINFKGIRESTPPMFRQNVAITGEIFNKEKHPYFKVEKGHSYMLDNNFGLEK